VRFHEEITDERLSRLPPASSFFLILMVRFYIFWSQRTSLSKITSPKILPPNMAPKDKPTLARIFSANRLKRFASARLLFSNAKDDMVVKEPQNPTATSKVYWGSRFNPMDKMENNPR
jgi:hypothetical protein